MLKDLFIHKQCEVTGIIYRLKKSIANLEKLKPHFPENPKIDEKLKECKELESKLLKAAKDPRFIRNLVDLEVKEKYSQVESFVDSQRRKAAKPRKVNDLTPQDREERDKKIVSHFRSSHLTMNNFANKFQKKYNLKPRRIRQIISKTVGNQPG